MILEGEVKSQRTSTTESRCSRRCPGFLSARCAHPSTPARRTVTAKSELTTLELDKAAFDRVLHKSTSVALAMVSEISNRLRQNDQMAVDDLRMRASEWQAYQQLAERWRAVSSLQRR
jgi:CRP-like cAMP-binding protein